MKFGFNYFTDEARDALEKIGVQWKREENTISIYTDYIDLVEEDLRDRWIERTEQRIDLHKAYREQTVRVWKNPDTGTYYYLFNNETLFYSYKKYQTDHSTTPPTQFEISVLDYPEDQEKFRDILLSRPAMARGVLI